MINHPSIGLAAVPKYFIGTELCDDIFLEFDDKEASNEGHFLDQDKWRPLTNLESVLTMSF